MQRTREDKILFQSWKGGHAATECSNEEACVACYDTGHEAGSKRCRVFRQGLTNEHKNTTERNPNYGRPKPAVVNGKGLIPEEWERAYLLKCK